MSYTIIGVTGHIDHGKTSLVEKLTGKNTDTHPEEKRRGITIDLGFATFDDGEDTFALIDAPGHQRYVGNLLSGVSRVDIGLLLVAADQGIQAQTIEHASILYALGVETLVVVISRCDLADAARCDELREEIEFFLTDTGFSDFPVVAISTKTGEGLAELCGTLKANANPVSRATDVEPSGERRCVRLPIDRAFRVDGRGWVAAGTLWSGAVEVGDALQLVRTGKELRVREIEQHGVIRSQALPARRTALNLAGEVEELRRGDELITPGSLRSSHTLAVELYMFADANDVKLPVEIQLHTATMACTAAVQASHDKSRRVLAAGNRQVVLLRSSQPIVLREGQPVLLRRPYPVGSFAGGRVVADLQLLAEQRYPNASISRKGQLLGRSPRSDEVFAIRLASAELDLAAKLVLWLEQLGEIGLDESSEVVKRLAGFYGVSAANIVQQLASLPLDTRDYQCAKLERQLVDSGFLDRVGAWQMKGLATANRREGELWQHRATVLQSCVGFCSEPTAKAALKNLVQSGELVSVANLIGIASSETKLSKKQVRQLTELVQLLESTPAPPLVKELATKLDTTQSQVEALARFAVHQKTLVDLGGGVLYARGQFETLVVKIVQFLGEGTATVAEIRDALDLTRKHAIPLLEYCDQQSITVRCGNDRSRGPGAQSFHPEVIPSQPDEA